MVCVSFLGLPWQMITNQVAWDNRNVLSHSSGNWSLKLECQQVWIPLQNLFRAPSASGSCWRSLALSCGCITPASTYAWKRQGYASRTCCLRFWASNFPSLGAHGLAFAGPPGSTEDKVVDLNSSGHLSATPSLGSPASPWCHGGQLWVVSEKGIKK